MKKIAILGGGLAGISLGYFLKRRGVDFKIYEQESEVGGLCRTFNDDKISYDVSGVHVIHSKNDEALALMLGILDNRVVKRERTARILYNKRWYAFPFASDIQTFPFFEKLQVICKAQSIMQAHTALPYYLAA